MLGSLDTPEQSRVEFKFQDVDTSNPSELRQAPELIGAVDSSEGKQQFNPTQRWTFLEDNGFPQLSRQVLQH